MCHAYANLKKMGGKRQHSKSPEDDVANAAETLCRSILRYKECKRCGKTLS